MLFKLLLWGLSPRRVNLPLSPPKEVSQFPPALYISWAPLVFQVRHFGGSSLHCRSQVLQFLMRASTSHSSGRNCIFEIFPDCGLPCQGWGFWQDHILLLHCGPLNICCEGDIQLVFRSFSQGIILYVAVDLVRLWKEIISGSSYTTMLDYP